MKEKKIFAVALVRVADCSQASGVVEARVTFFGVRGTKHLLTGNLDSST